MNDEATGTDEFGPVGPTILTNLGGGALMLASLMTVLAGVLIWKTSIIYSTVMKPAPFMMMVFGLLGIFCGGGMIKARDWAAVVGAGLTGLLLLLNLVFNIWAGLNGGFYSWSAIAMVFSMIAAILVPFAVKDCIVASRNRRKLFDGI